MKRNKIFTLILIVVSMAMGFSSCIGNDDDYNNNQKPTIDPVTYSYKDIYLNMSMTAYPFFSQVNSSVEKNKNFMISPLGMSEVLTMLVHGANGNTAAQINKVMNTPWILPAHIMDAMKSLNDFLPKADSKTALAIANSQWIDEGYDVKNDYIKNNIDKLDAETFTQLLSTEATKNDINSWCARKTNGLIKAFLKSPLQQNTRMVLLNALYFKGQWKYKFDKKETTDKTFHNIDGTTSDVKMMHQEGKLLCWSGEKMDVAEFPYGNETFCMDVILPHEGESIDNCLKGIDYVKMYDILHNMNFRNAYIDMPRMQLDYDRTLNADLIAMGMPDAFDIQKADFSGITDRKLFISLFKQATSLTVNEEGTEAASITSSEMMDSSVPNISYFHFEMNRPFAFLIREKQSGIILFMGKMVKF